MRIPDIQERLRQIARERNVPELIDLAAKLSRRPPKRKAPTASQPMTDHLRAQIRAYAAQNADATQAEIGRQFNVNPGRVSEALRGLRK